MCDFLWLVVCVSVYGLCGVVGVIACGNSFLVKRGSSQKRLALRHLGM